MQLSKVDRLMLFTLGSWHRGAAKRLEGRPLRLSITKVAFIKAIMSAGIAGKKERALYQNLEDLEKRRLVGYKGRSLALTKAGERHFQRIAREIVPYTTVLTVLSQKDPLSYAKTLQTRFANI